MLEASDEENPCLEAVLDNAPVKVGTPTPVGPYQLYNPLLLLPAAKRLQNDGKGIQESMDRHRSYIHYSGSLTTPPCSEEVDWFVMTDPVAVSQLQVPWGGDVNEGK